MRHNACYTPDVPMSQRSRVLQAVPPTTVGEGVEMSRPPLKWAGGKRWQLPHLVEHWAREKHRRLVEPFCGGLAVTLGLAPERAFLNDVNPHLINFYRWLRTGLVITLPMSNVEARYYTHRERFNKLLSAGQGETAEAA